MQSSGSQCAHAPNAFACNGTLRWDVFCRVIDNHGDLGVCWRLCTQLAAAGEPVRLWCDDASALAWMAPCGAPNVQVLPWRDPVDDEQPGHVVVEAFGCDPPPAFVERMRAMPSAPLWINLEYLSAEAYVERSHGLPSPQMSGPGQRLTKWFFYPGFTEGTGGLLREPGLGAAQTGFDRHAFLGSLGIDAEPVEQVVSLFSYHIAALDSLLTSRHNPLTLLLLSPGPAREQALQTAARHAGVRTVELPWLSQFDYDHLLSICDVNAVRGEDSWVRALWAGKPFLWQAYPQHDGAHADKVRAFVQRLVRTAPAPLATAVSDAFNRWNGLSAAPFIWPDVAAWHALCQDWRAHLWQQADLATQLRGFVAQKRAAPTS